MTAASFCAVALIGAMSAFSLREFGWRGTPIFALTVALALLSFGVRDGHFAQTVGLLTEIPLSADMSETVTATLKILGVGYLCRLTADFCVDLGEGGIARAVEAVSRLEIIWISLPFLRELLSLALSVLP